MAQTMDPSANSDVRGIWKVIGASSAGTLIEWYDFYIFGSLATVLATQFYPKENGMAALLSVLATFAVGFVVRPFGAIVFGQMGDKLGRKYTFLLTLMLMGLSTFAIGLLPTYAQMGWGAPLILLILRTIQGLALGGEYGGAATYVAEHAPSGRRGYYTSFIQTTATLGLFISLLVILGCRSLVGEADFAVWGWRLPFLLSVVLVFFSYLVRRKMNESPEFAELKSQGKTSENPIRESFVNPENRRWVLIALFGATAGQGVVWYTGQFYALYYLQTVMMVEAKAANLIIAAALVIGTPFFIFFGSLSDRIGRKRLMMSACLIAAIVYLPIYAVMHQQTDLTGREVASAQPEVKVTSSTDPVTKAVTQTTVATQNYVDGTIKISKTPLEKDGKPDKTKIEIHPTASTSFILVLLVLAQVLLVTMVYGPIAAFLVELFPTHIRYTSMSLPYHIGNGVFGGLTPLIGTWMVSKTGNYLAGLAWPIGIALMTFIVGSKYLTDDMSIKE